MNFFRRLLGVLVIGRHHDSGHDTTYEGFWFLFAFREHFGYNLVAPRGSTEQASQCAKRFFQEKNMHRVEGPGMTT
jgi:hypothetical protein